MTKYENAGSKILERKGEIKPQLQLEILALLFQEFMKLCEKPVSL